MITAYIIFSLITYLLVIYVDFYKGKEEWSLRDFILYLFFSFIPLLNIGLFYFASCDIKFKRK